MKIGILTFHWATNYGAILQSYALSTFLNQNGFDAEIIRYEPKNYKVSKRNILQVRSFRELKEYCYKLKLEKKLDDFREKSLVRSRQIYNTTSELYMSQLNYECIVVGSDQIWNMSFAKYEGLVYYLEFLDKKVRKISYAASFGTNSIDPKLKNRIGELLREFNFISVREKSGINIVESIGQKASIVCDPVFLMNASFYHGMISSKKEKVIFIYMLKNDKKKWMDKISSLSKDYRVVVYGEKKTYSVEDWLSLLCNSALVITDSFHGTAFSLLFNTPFISVKIDGSGMNDRLLTILSTVSLENHFVSEYEIDQIRDIPTIDWDQVNKSLKKYSDISKQILLNALDGGC